MHSLKIITSLILVLFCVGSLVFLVGRNYASNSTKSILPAVSVEGINQNPLSIEAMRQQSYLGSDLKIEQTLADGSNYHQYIASYLSDNLKIYGLLTIPIGNPPSGGWPAII